VKKISEVTALVCDHGRFVHVARCLGQQMAKVYYTSPEERDNPLIREASVGEGFPEIERVKSAWEVKDECDVVVFPDIGFECMQRELRYQGIPVWGPGDASYLESHKGIFLDALKETDLPVAPHVVIKGLTNLMIHLKEEEDKYIKIDTFRGDWETMHWTCWEEMEGELDSYAVRFGPLKDQITFYVFDSIESEVEDGIDACRVGGQWPETVLHGMECKDKAFIGTMTEFAEIAEEVRRVNEVFGPILDRMTQGGAMKFSTEVRITEDKQSFFIDPTCRFGSPPSQGECLLIKNLPEIIYRGAMGQLVEPETEDDFVVQAFLSVCGDRDEWKSLSLDHELDDAIKGGFCCQVDDRLCLMPMTEYHTSEVGYLVATGKTMKAAIEKLRDLKDKLPCSLKCEFNSLADVLKEIQEAEKADMPFTQEIVPEPEEIING
jgi:hypothetical protein